MTMIKEEIKGLREEYEVLDTSDLQGRAMVISSKLGKELHIKPNKVTESGYKYYWDIEEILLEYAQGDIDINTAQRLILDLPKEKHYSKEEFDKETTRIDKMFGGVTPAEMGTRRKRDEKGNLTWD